MNIRIIPVSTVGYIEMDKRQHLPFILESACPNCSAMVQKDLSEDEYLSYPQIGKYMKIYFNHEDCPAVSSGTEWHFQIKVDVTLTVDMSPQK